MIIKSEKANTHLTKAGVEKRVGELAEKAGLPDDVTPHVLRHTTATLALRQGMAVTDVQKMLGHSNINTTMVYINTDDKEMLKSQEKYVN